MKSIRAKLWMGMMILIVIIIFLLWLFQIVFLDKFYSIMETDGVKENAIEIVDKITNLEQLENIENQDIVGEIENLVYEKQLTVEILDKNYTTLYEGNTGSGMTIPGVIRDEVDSIIENAMMGDLNETIVHHPRFNYKVMTIGIPIEIEGSIKGVMVVMMPLASIDETKTIITTQLFFITILLIVISIIIAFIISKKIASPITKISNQAEMFEKGKYDVRIEKHSDDEIGHLADRMNSMGEALGQNEKLQKEIIANVSHELRTPITLIKGYAETILDITGDNKEKREKQLKIIVDETDRLNRMVGDILDLSTIQSGIKELEIEKFELLEILKYVKVHFSSEEVNIKLNFETEENIFVECDKNKILQVLYNLVGNAIRHRGDDDIVEIYLELKKDEVKIHIKDHGDGISEEDLKYIFERYYKGKRIEGVKKEGTGLGLSIVKSILELHKSQYGVESKIGEGTDFWFNLKIKG